jgi:hypothetical protein
MIQGRLEHLRNPPPCTVPMRCETPSPTAPATSACEWTLRRNRCIPTDTQTTADNRFTIIVACIISTDCLLIWRDGISILKERVGERENYHSKERKSSLGLDSIHERVPNKEVVTTIADRGFQTLQVNKLSSSDQENNRYPPSASGSVRGAPFCASRIRLRALW